MITLHEAIRSVQDELIKSEQERVQRGIPRLFETEKLTIEFSCVFSETEGTQTQGGVKALSVLSLDAASANSVSSQQIQKVTVEFKTADAEGPEGGSTDQRSVPRRPSDGRYPHA